MDISAPRSIRPSSTYRRPIRVQTNGTASLIAGATVTGKTWLACALGCQAARRGLRVLYNRTTRLLRELRFAHRDGSFGRRLAQLSRIDVLLLDDFAGAPIEASERTDPLELLDDRVDAKAKLITSQLAVSAWHAWLDDLIIADEILDRTVHGSRCASLKGPPPRKPAADTQGHPPTRGSNCAARSRAH